jgi:Pyridoxamine 5'-phosphate oxidase
MELAAPEIARLGMARLNSARVAMLGTLRRDGSPRISPIEPYFAQAQLLIGAMAWSAKAADLRRDPRSVLHSVVTGPDSGESSSCTGQRWRLTRTFAAQHLTPGG